MPEWIEFNAIWGNSDVDPISVRVYQIGSVKKTGDKSCNVVLDNEQGSYYAVAESYEDVMKKIQEAEGPVDLSNCVVEHFTSEEYAVMLRTVKNEIKADEALDHPHGVLTQIADKLIEILKENK